jgi:hypothetical protein
MKTAISSRLDDLQAVARKLQALLDAEDGRQPLPGKVLARLAVAVDEASSALERHHGALAPHQEQRQ